MDRPHIVVIKHGTGLRVDVLNSIANYTIFEDDPGVTSVVTNCQSIKQGLVWNFVTTVAQNAAGYSHRSTCFTKASAEDLQETFSENRLRVPMATEKTIPLRIANWLGFRKKTQGLDAT